MGIIKEGMYPALVDENCISKNDAVEVLDNSPGEKLVLVPLLPRGIWLNLVDDCISFI